MMWTTSFMQTEGQSNQKLSPFEWVMKAVGKINSDGDAATVSDLAEHVGTTTQLHA
jgi:hypothetical protein